MFIHDHILDQGHPTAFGCGDQHLGRDHPHHPALGFSHLNATMLATAIQHQGQTATLTRSIRAEIGFDGKQFTKKRRQGFQVLGLCVANLDIHWF